MALMCHPGGGPSVTGGHGVGAPEMCHPGGGPGADPGGGT
jgi:hypothetical protein